MGILFQQVSSHPSSPANRLGSAPAAALALVFSAGIGFSLICRAYSFGGLAAGNMLMICAAFLAWRRNRIGPALAASLASILLGGLLTGVTHRDRYRDSDLRHLIPQQRFPLDEPVSFEGCVIEDGRKRGDETSTLVELQAFFRGDRWTVCEGKAILRVADPARGESSPPPVSLARGDRVRGWAVWHTPRNFENPGSADRSGQLARRGIFLLGRAKSPRLLEKIPGACGNAWSSLAASVSAHVRSGIEHVTPDATGQNAAILASLLIGDYSGLNNATREVFQNSGTYHVLVVSGLHVAWISGLLLRLFKGLFLPERIRYLLTALVILLYTCVVGFQASITRCLWMFSLYLVGRMIFRRANPANILMASALILLTVQPDWLFDTGFQLSFLSVLAIALTAAPASSQYLRPLCDPLINSGNADRLFLRPGRWHRTGRNLRVRCEILIEGMTDSLPPAAAAILFRMCRGIGGAGLAIGSMILASISVQLWIEPLLALNFNRMSWISPFANLIMVPLSSVVLASGIAASLAARLPHIGPACLSLSGWLAAALLRAAEGVAGIPGAWQRCPTPSTAWVLAGVLTLFLWSFFRWRRFWIPCAGIAALLLCLSLGSVPGLGGLCGMWRRATGAGSEEEWPRDAPILSLTFLDVGEGDSIVLRFPDGRIWVLDAGGLRLPPSHDDNAYAFDVGEAVVSRYLWQEWITRLDRVILSHTDTDHAGGISALLKNFRVAEFDHSNTGSDAIMDGIVSLGRQRGAAENLLQSGTEEWAARVRVNTLHPPPGSGRRPANENSVVLHISYKEFSALLTGDLEKAGELELLSRPAEIQSQLLKVAHHGSRSGTSDALLDRVRPRWAVLSVGQNNPFGHPSREVLARIRRHGAQPFLTMDEGAITFETDGNRYAIRGHVRGVLERGVVRQKRHESPR